MKINHQTLTNKQKEGLSHLIAVYIMGWNVDNMSNRGRKWENQDYYWFGSGPYDSSYKIKDWKPFWDANQSLAVLSECGRNATYHHSMDEHCWFSQAFLSYSDESVSQCFPLHLTDGPSQWMSAVIEWAVVAGKLDESKVKEVLEGEC